jgi:hypothetical protein
MTGDDEAYQNDVRKMMAGLAGIDFDQLTPKQIEAHDRKARKGSEQRQRRARTTEDQRRAASPQDREAES